MVSTSSSRAQYKFSCCQAHAPVLDNINPEQNGEESEKEDTYRECSYKTSRPWKMKEDLENHKATCQEVLPRKFLKSFYYSERSSKESHGMSRMGGIFVQCFNHERYSIYHSQCSRLDNEYDGECENEMQTSVSDGANQLVSLVGLKVDCRNGMKKNGRPITDGKRRFLRGFIMKMNGGGYRYVYSCCRIQRSFTTV